MIQKALATTILLYSTLTAINKPINTKTNYNINSFNYTSKIEQIIIQEETLNAMDSLSTKIKSELRNKNYENVLKLSNNALELVKTYKGEDKNGYEGDFNNSISKAYLNIGLETKNKENFKKMLEASAIAAEKSPIYYENIELLAQAISLNDISYLHTKNLNYEIAINMIKNKIIPSIYNIKKDKSYLILATLYLNQNKIKKVKSALEKAIELTDNIKSKKKYEKLKTTINLKTSPITLYQ